MRLLTCALLVGVADAGTLVLKGETGAEAEISYEGTGKVQVNAPFEAEDFGCSAPAAEGADTVCARVAALETANAELETKMAHVLALLAPPPSPPPSIPTSGLLAYYRFENSFANSFGGAPSVQNHNGVGFTGGEVGSAASFNLGSYLTVNGGMPGYSQGGSLTTAAWIYLQSSRDDGGTGGNVEGRGVWAVGNNANRQRWYMRNYCNPDTHCYLAIGIHDGDADVWLSFPIREWHHVAATYDKPTRTVRTYHDGVLMATRVLGSDLNMPNSVKIGMDGYGNSRMHGRIDEAGFWNRAISEGEMPTLMTGGPP